MDEELYIRMVNNRPVDHPMLRSNIESAFPEVDFDNLPSWLARFERVQKPHADVYEIVNGPIYVVVGDTVKDQWIKRPMTEDEKLLKQSRARQNFLNDTTSEVRRSTWVFDEATCSFNAPIPYPSDGGAYVWSDNSQNWETLVLPPAPEVVEGNGVVSRKPVPRIPGTWEWDEATQDWIKTSDDPPPEGVLTLPPAV